MMKSDNAFSSYS